mgnify:CR=1 FL=1
MELTYDLAAEPRAARGKGATRRLRRADRVPGVIYGGDRGPVAITLDQNELERKLKDVTFFSHVITVRLPDGEEKVVVRDLQRHPYKPTVLHIDLLRITGREYVKVIVPIIYLNEDRCKGVKLGGRVDRNAQTVELLSPPDSIPTKIEVDLANLDIGDSVTLSKLPIPDGSRVALLQKSTAQDQPVVVIQSK